MKRVCTYALAGLLIMAAPTGLSAEDKTRFESSGFLQSLDLFIAEQMAKFRSKPQDSEKEDIKELELSLRDSSEKKDSGFLYLRDTSIDSKLSSSSVALANKPDFSSLLAPNGMLRGKHGQDILGAQSLIGVTLGANKNDPTNKGIEIAVQSGYRLSMPEMFGDTNMDLAARHYNVGLSVGYSGFNVDASLVRQTDPFDTDLYGYDVGFSYQATSWSARFGLSEYKEGTDLYGLENEARNIISVELGANYRLTDRMGLSGGVRYYDYGSRLMLNPEQGENSQMVFLGGSLRF